MVGHGKALPTRRPVYLDAALALEHLIAFHAGTHRDSVHMLTAEYLRLVRPMVAHLTRVEAGQGWQVTAGLSPPT